ncbi:MAG: DNA-directed RNA polymerase subunit B [Candidatus Micrarchaeia archaeon]
MATAKQAETEKCYVYLNGVAIGTADDPASFTQQVRNLRRTGRISGEVNIAYLKSINEVHINTDKGRIRKPYIIVENGKSKFTEEIAGRLERKEIDFNYLLRNGIIEYLDAEEEENAFVAMNESEITDKTTHLELTPASVFGLTINTAPYPNHNNVARHLMFASYIKQAQGLFASNFNLRFDSRGYLLFYPQRPIVGTRVYNDLQFEKRSSGQNFVVAISTYYGYNIADAVVINKAAVDRGLARSVFYKTYTDEERRYPGGQHDTFKIPPATTEDYLGEHAYSKLGEDGLIEPETQVDEGDVLVGKVSPPRFLEESLGVGGLEEKTRDSSTILKRGENGVVDDVIIAETLGATKLVKVRIRSLRIPEIGDKFGSRHGQKGVIGMIVPQEDMPFSESGIVPDLLLNPNGITSRMTFGHLLEMLTGKASSLTGKLADGTAFSKDGKQVIEESAKILEAYGFDRYGDEVLYNGITGEKLSATIFTGVVYYNRLYHMVANKLQVRSRGTVQILTHQPTEGKARQGGLRFGEMEKDVLVGHGASLLLKDRLLDQSDKAEIWVCNECGSVGYYDYAKKVPVCPVCGSNNLSKVEISYAFKLLLDELKAMHINPSIKLSGGD